MSVFDVDRVRCDRRHPRSNRRCAAKAIEGYHECRFHSEQTPEGLVAIEQAAQERAARRAWRKSRFASLQANAAPQQ